VLVAVVLLAWVGIAGIGGPAMGKLSEVQTNDSAQFLPDGAESVRAAAAEAAISPQSTLPALLVVTRPDGGALTGEDLAVVDGLGRAAADAALPGDLTVADVLGSDPVVVPAEDGEAAMVVLPIDAELTEEPLAGGESVVGAVVEAVRAAVADPVSDAGLTSALTGPAGFVADLTDAFGSIDVLLLLVALGVVLVILLVVYRSPILPFTVLLTSVLALSLSGLVVYHLADAGLVQLSGQSQGIMSILVIGAATDYGLLLVARQREELAVHESPYRAMRAAWRASLPPIAASAGTVALGLLCLLLSDLGSNSSLGPIAAIGIASALVAALTVLPAMLLIGGRRARFMYWPRVPRVRGEGSDGTGEAKGAEDGPGLWGRVARLVGRRPRRVWVITAVALMAGASLVPTLRATGTSQSDVFLAQSEAVDGEAVLAEHFPAGAVQPVSIVTTEQRAAAVITAAQDVDGVTQVDPASEGAPGGAPNAPGGKEGAPDESASAVPGGDGPGEVGDDVGGRVLLSATTEAPADTDEAVETVERLRDAVHEADPDALVGGAAAETLDTRLSAERDLRVVIPAVLVVILLTLMVLLRSVLAPVLLLAANVLSFATAMGLVAVVFNHVLRLPGADPTVPLFGFVFLVALGIDYTIFLMTRTREEARSLGTRRGVRRALAVTGGVITSAGVVLAATFAALGVVPLLFLLQLAIIVSLGVLIDTLVVRSLLVPALVHDIGNAVWWPAHRGRPDDGPRAVDESHADSSVLVGSRNGSTTTVEDGDR
jgi:RND superfamily putative drug exporter